MTPKQRRDGNSKPTLTPHQQMVAERAQLLSAAHELQRLAPWGWMGGTTLFGVRTHDRAEPDWVCVLGGNAEVYGLAVYVGWFGFDLMGLVATGLIDEDDLTGTQDSYLLAFEPKSQFTPTERSEIDGCGLRFAPEIGWPVFERHEPGSVRSRLSIDEVRHLRVVVEQVLDVSRRVRDEALDLHGNDERNGFVRAESRSTNAATGEQESSWTDEIVEIPPPKTFEIPPVDESALVALQDKPRNDGACIQVDVFPAASFELRDGVSFIPYTSMIVDLATGDVLDGGPATASDRFDRCRSRLVQWMRTQESLPHRIQVTRPQLVGWLDSLCDPLNIELVIVDDMPELEDARMAFEDEMGGR